MMPAGALRRTRFGWGVALPVLFLLAVGLACIYATERGDQPTSALVPLNAPAAPASAQGALASALSALGADTTRQILFLISGLGLLALTVWPSYQWLGRFAWLFYAAVLALLSLLVVDRFVDVPFVPVVRFTRRWFALGPFTIQPSEFMKLALVVALARYLRFRSSYRRWRGLIPPFLMTIAPMVLILLQPDLGTLLMLLPVLFAMLFAAGARAGHLLTVVVLGLATLPIFYQVGMHDYQKQRVDVLLRQSSGDESWHMGPGYQLRQSKIALGTGGLTGEGFGQGVFIERRGGDLLPEEHNDFIFAIIGHQWGFAGCVLVIAAYGVIVLFGFEVAMSTNDPFGRLLVVGVVTMIVMQALLNMTMTIGLAPITGMPLPFVSAGGSSLWANFLALGLLLNVAQRRPMLIAHAPFEHAED